MKRKEFYDELVLESERWKEAGLLEEPQIQTLLDFSRTNKGIEKGQKKAEAVPPTSSATPSIRQAPPRQAASRTKSSATSEKGWVPALLIGLAVVLLGVGIFLFYAANWRKMPPSLKLVQVFALLLGLYTSGYYVLAIRKSSMLLGRALMFLGMVSFGAAISLIAQIFHISAHPSNGVLVWAIAVIATSWVLRERWGAYLGAALVLLWNLWEVTQFYDKNLAFLLVLPVLTALFVRLKERVGLVVCSLYFVLFLGQTHGFWLYELVSLPSKSGNTLITVMVLLCMPIGLFVAALGRYLKGFEIARPAGVVLLLCGWSISFLPWLGLSWPFRTWEIANVPMFSAGVGFFLAEYLLLLGAVFGLSLLLRKRGESDPMLLFGMGLAVALMVLPLGQKTVLVTGMHVGLLLYLFGLLYTSYLPSGTNASRAESKWTAFGLLSVTLFVKWCAFVALGITQFSSRYFLAYVLGSVILGLICFFANRLIRAALSRRNIRFPTLYLDIHCMFLAYLSFYVLSFKLESQQSIFSAKPMVLILLATFVVLALLLFAILWKQSQSRLIPGLAGLIFLCTLGALLVTGPSLSWLIYSIGFNTMLFVFVGVLIYYSVQVNSKALANFAILGFILHVTTRYFDTLWDLLSGSVLFITTGLLVLAGGYWLERNRRKLMEQFEETTTRKAPTPTTGGTP